MKRYFYKLVNNKGYIYDCNNILIAVETDLETAKLQCFRLNAIDNDFNGLQVKVFNNRQKAKEFESVNTYSVMQYNNKKYYVYY